MAFNATIESFTCNKKIFPKNKPPLWKLIYSEFIGTACLLFFCCASSVSWTEKPSLLQGSIAAGFIVASIVQFTCHVSGGHINPAVSLAFFVTGKLPGLDFVVYVITQCAGAIAGSALFQLFSNEENIGITTINTDAISEVKGFGIEVAITFFMVSTAFSVSDTNRIDLKGSAPVAVGLVVAACVLVAGPVTGASMNPARTLGPAVVNNNWDHHWVYWIGPCLGSVTAGVSYQIFFQAKESEDNKHNLELLSETGDKTVSINLENRFNNQIPRTNYS